MVAVYSPTSLMVSLDLDDLAVDIVTELFESFSDLESVDRAEDSAGRAGLGTDRELNAFESGGSSLSVGLDLSELVGALTLVFGEDLERAFGGDHSFALGMR